MKSLVVKESSDKENFIYMNKLVKKLLMVVTCVFISAGIYAQDRSRDSSEAQDKQLADYIVAIVQFEPITDSQVRVHMLTLKRGIDAKDLPPDSELRKIALAQLITQSALAQRAQEMGMRIDPKMVEQALTSIAQNNGMTQAELEKELLKDGIPLTTLHSEIERQMLIAQLREKTLDPTISVSNTEINQYMNTRSGNGDPAQELISLAQILVVVPEKASEVQVKKLQARAQDIYEKAKKASNSEFITLADKYSDDPTVASTHGLLGVKPASRYPELFVNAVVDLAPGSVTPPVRSGAGFHIIRVMDREGVDNVNTVVVQTHVRHILLNISDKQTEEQVIEKLLSDKRQVEAGLVTFETLAQEQSKDASAKEGGNLGWVVPGMFVPEFERAMDQLKPGEISEPVVTRYGVHLIQVIDRREAQLTEAQRREIARETIHQAKIEQAYERWARDIESSAYVEIRNP